MRKWVVLALILAFVATAVSYGFRHLLEKGTGEEIRTAADLDRCEKRKGRVVVEDGTLPGRIILRCRP